MGNEPNVFCVYGEDLLKTVEEYSPWVKAGSDRHLLLLRREEETIPLFLLIDPQIHLLSIDASDEEMKQKLWDLLFFSFSYKICGSPKDLERIERCFARVEKCRLGIHLSASDFKDMGKRILSNYLANFHHLSRAKRGRELFGKFKRVPALILAAGPSLEEEIPMIRAWENRALLFAGGSSLNVLSTFSLQPHFSAALDPDPPRARFLAQTAFEVPFFYQSRVSQELLSSMHAPLLSMVDSQSYPIDSWMHEQVGLKEPPFDAGWNVSTFCTALAHALGCSPIIFVGLELSTRSQRVYAKGVEEEIGKEFIETRDCNGDKVYTKQDWMMAGEWLEQFAREHPDVQFVNATRGGLPLAGIERLSLSRVREKYGKEMCDIKGVLHKELSSLKPSVSLADIQKVTEEVEASFERCKELSTKLLTLHEKRYACHSGGTGERALYEVELEDEIAFKTFLAPLWEIWGPLFLREAQAMDRDLHRLLFFQRILNDRNI